MERAEEIYARDLLRPQNGAALRKIAERDVPTADYELVVDNVRVAVLEVKRLEPTPRDEEYGWRRDPSTGFMTRPGNSPSRVAAHIHNAHKQLSRYSEPKILVFVNDEGLADALDLDDTVHGYLDYGTEETGYLRNYAASKTAAVRRIDEEKWSIDLYIWINRYDGRFLHRVDGQPTEPHAERDRPWFRFVTEAGHEVARRYFGIPEVPRPR